MTPEKPHWARIIGIAAGTYFFLALLEQINAALAMGVSAGLVIGGALLLKFSPDKEPT